MPLGEGPNETGNRAFSSFPPTPTLREDAADAEANRSGRRCRSRDERLRCRPIAPTLHPPTPPNGTPRNTPGPPSPVMSEGCRPRSHPACGSRTATGGQYPPPPQFFLGTCDGVAVLLPHVAHGNEPVFRGVAPPMSRSGESYSAPAPGTRLEGAESKTVIGAGMASPLSIQKPPAPLRSPCPGTRRPPPPPSAGPFRRSTRPEGRRDRQPRAERRPRSLHPTRPWARVT
jgi:hypothetical protein